jgi:hypothetical protein
MTRISARRNRVAAEPEPLAEPVPLRPIDVFLSDTATFIREARDGTLDRALEKRIDAKHPFDGGRHFGRPATINRAFVRLDDIKKG